MARRVNTKFVIGLGTVLFVSAGGVLAFVTRSTWYGTDPQALALEGDKAYKDHDLGKAVSYYERAAAESSKSHKAGTERLYDKLGDLTMEYSAATSSPIDSTKRYAQAQAAWKRAITENASYVPAREKLIEEQFKIAMYDMRSENWSALEETAAKLTAIDPGYGKAFTYLAAARLALLTPTGSIPLNYSQVKVVDETIQAAMKADPDNATPWVLRAELLRMEAAHVSPPSPTEQKNLTEAAVAGLVKFMQAHPNDADAAVSLASLYWSLKNPDGAVKVLESAVAAHPKHVRAASMLAGFYGEQKSLDKAEKVLKDLVSANGSDADSLMALGRFYQTAHKSVEAIDAFNKAMDHPQLGGGITAAVNIRCEVEALFDISWLYMDVAEGKARASQPAEVKEALAEARIYADKLRAAQSQKHWQDLVEGRLQLLSGNTREAIVALTRADAVFGKASAAAPQWLQTKAALSQAFETDMQWGTALKYLNEIMAQYPNQPGLMLQKARILCRVAQWKEASRLGEQIANAPAEAHISADLQDGALQVMAEAYRGQGLPAEAYKAEMRRGGIKALLAIASDRLREDDKEGALQEVNAALKMEPTNESALVMGVVINLRLDKKEDASALLEKALGLYPKNTQLTVIRKLLSDPNGDQKLVQLGALREIADPFTQHMSVAQFYGQWHDLDKQLGELEEALKVMEGGTATPPREALSQLCDEIFKLNLQGSEDSRNRAAEAKQRADGAKDGKEKAAAAAEAEKFDKASKEYWARCEMYAQKAERQNLDGVEGKLYRGRLNFSAGGELRKAGLQTLEQAEAESPNNSVVRTVLGQAYFVNRRADNSDGDKAMAEFREAIQQKPDNIMALRLMIILLLQKSTPESLNEAQGYLTSALSFAPRDRILRDAADQLAMNGVNGADLAESIRKREEVRKQNPNDLENLRSLAILYVHEKLPLKGVELLKIIQGKYPEDLTLADTIAHLLHEGHKDDLAQTEYEHFIASDTPAVRFRATLLLGDLYKTMDRIQQAKDTFTGAIALQQGTDEAQRRLADLYFDVDDMKNAEQTYAAIYGAEKVKDVRVLRRLVESMLRQDEFAAADAEINALLASQPEDSDGWILRGFGLLRQQKAAEAIACFNHVLAANPKNLDALHYRAFAEFSSTGDLAQATQDLLKIRESDPYRANSLILLAKVYRKSHRFAESADEYEEVIKLQPDVPAYRIEYGQFLLSVADVVRKLSPDNQEDFASGLRVVRAVERLDALLKDSADRFKDQPIWLILQGNLLTLQNKPAEGARLYLAAFEKSNGSPQVGSIYLGALMTSQDYEKVISLAGQLLEKQPKYGDYYLKRGAAYGQIKKYPEAMADFAQAMELAGNDMDLYLSVIRQAESAVPAETLRAFLNEKLAAHGDDVAARIGLADVYLINKDGENAVKTLAPLGTDSGKAYHLLVMRMTGIAKLLSKDTEGAYAAYAEVLKAAPTDIEVMNNMAFMLAEDMHRPKDALKFAESAVKLIQAGKVDLAYVNNGNIYDTYGWVKFLNGDVAGGITELRRAQQIEPTPVIYLHLAKAYKASGDLSKSREALAEGIRLGKPTKDANMSQLEGLQKEIGTE